MGDTTYLEQVSYVQSPTIHSSKGSLVISCAVRLFTRRLNKYGE